MRLKSKKIYLLLSVFFVSTLFFGHVSIANQENINTVNTNESEYIYLSDMNYKDIDGYKSFTGWGNIEKDRNPDKTTIKLRKDGEIVSYPKGVGFHASGQLVYDISKYSSTYTKFISKIGVDASKPTVSSLTVEFLASNDGKNWTQLYKSGKLSSSMDAIDIELNIEGYQYLRIYTDSLGDKSSDHCILADARLTKKDYNVSSELYNKLKTLGYYDEILSKKTVDENYNNNKNLILQREFVNKFGYWNLQNIASSDATSKTALDWILDNQDILEQVIEVGEISDAYKFLNSLGSLYNEYSNLKTDADWNLYKKMMIALSAAYSTDKIASPLTFGHYVANYNVIERFKSIKDLYNQGKFLRTNEFKTLEIELLRLVMQDALRTDETNWFYHMTRNEKNEFKNKIFYLAYISPNYNHDESFDIANKDRFDSKYHLSDYGVPFGDDRTQRYWMAFEYGGICWNTSRTGQSTYRINGVPATGVYQPGHEAFVYYNENEKGQGYWKMENNIGTWGRACTKWWGGNRYRLLLDWGNKSYADQVMNNTHAGNSAGYIILAQANINNYEHYQKSLYYNLIANSYTETSKKIETYKKALSISDNINLDCYDYIIKNYETMGDDITQEEWVELANEITKAYTYYPNAMYDLLKIIKPHISGSKRAEIEMLETQALERASKATAEESLQFEEIKPIASVLLGRNESPIATFSFDGDDARKIIIGDDYSIKWSYSIDNGNTWSSKITDKTVTLTQDEIEKITDENDIKLQIEGTELIYTIDILKSTIPVTNGHSYLYGNDLENRVIGIDDTMEWRYSEEDTWTDYIKNSPVLSGEKQVQVRVKATRNYIPSDYETFTFTHNEENPTKKYIPVSHLSIKEVSTEAVNNGGRATNAIDGNYNTRYHSAWNGTDTNRYMIIEIDRIVYLSAVQYFPAGGGNGRIEKGTLYGSLDGENWEPLTEQQTFEYKDTSKQNEYDFGLNNNKWFNLDEAKPVKYVKIVADKASNGNWFTARMFNLYQDITKDVHPTAGISYSTTKPTNGEVTARLVNLSPEGTKITSKTNTNSNDTYIFKENGEFTFTFEDANGNIGTATAVVNNIDKEIKEPTIQYSTDTLTSGSVVATLVPNEEIMIINNGKFKVNDKGKIVSENGTIIVEDFSVDKNGNVINGNVIKDDEDDDDEEHIIETFEDNFKYEFITNGTHIFYYIDRAGNIGSTTVTVDWIDNTPPKANLTYDITHITNKDVTVKLEFNEENVKITNNGGKDTYTFTNNDEVTFTFEDTAGNANQTTAIVNWIDKEKPNAKIEYSTTKNTDGLVIAKLIEPSEDIIIVNNNSINTYTFTKNDTFKFIIKDEAGNTNEVVADVNWINLDSENDISSDEYKVDMQDKFIKGVPRNIEVNEFSKKLTSRNGFVVRDKYQLSLLGTETTGTGMRVCVNDKVYTVVVSADIDGNGELTLTDFAKLCLHYIGDETLTGENFVAGDLDNNGELSLTDLAKMQLLLIED